MSATEKCAACNGTGTRRICCGEPIEDCGPVCCEQHDLDDCEQCKGTGKRELSESAKDIFRNLAAMADFWS